MENLESSPTDRRSNIRISSTDEPELGYRVITGRNGMSFRVSKEMIAATTISCLYLGEVQNDAVEEPSNKRKQVTVKFLSRRLYRGEMARRRHQDEYTVLSRLDHPNIPKALDYGSVPYEDGDLPFSAIEYFPGKSLDIVTSSNDPLPWRTAKEIGIQVAETVDYIHGRGILHMDIKPANIIFRQEGDQTSIAVIDFGLAKFDGSAPEEDGYSVGTVYYAAPEVVVGEPNSPKSDVFSLGVTLYEILTGKRPFTGVATTRIFKKIVNDTPKPLREFCPDLPESMERVVMTALEKKPENRYTAADLKMALEAIEI